MKGKDSMFVHLPCNAFNPNGKQSKLTEQLLFQEKGMHGLEAF
jgi:hypothetical protein